MQILSFEMTPFIMNCYVVIDGDEALVIDPGEGRDDLLQALEGKRVRQVINTHGHGDHCAGNAAVLRHTGAELLIHKEDLPLLRSLEQQGMMFGVCFEASPDPDAFLSEGDTITVGDTVLRIMHTPGHSPGHIVLAGEGMVIVGDVLFAGSIGRTDLPGGNYDQLIHSIHSKLLTLPDDTVVYAGHGPATTTGHERETNPFLQAK